MSAAYIAAIRKGDLASVKQHLLKEGASCTDGDGFPLLHICVIHGKEEIAKFLIEHGAHIEGKRPDGSTAMHQAAWENKPNFLNILISGGANVDAQNDRGTTPLAFAAGKGFDACVQSLCFQGAKLLKNNNGKSPIDVAEEKGQHTCATILKEYEKKLASGGAAGAAAAAGPCNKCAELTKELEAFKAELAAEKKKNEELTEKLAAAEKKE